MFFKKISLLLLILNMSMTFLVGMKRQSNEIVFGLPNEGTNNCFMNASLQCLKNLKGFTEAVAIDVNNDLILKSLSNILQNSSENKGITNQHPFYGHVRKNLFGSTNLTQEDPMEFIEYLIGLCPDFEEQIKITTNSEKKCNKCSSTTQKNESDYILKCEIPEAEYNKSFCSLEDCISSFGNFETVNAKCEQCSKNKDVSCRKKFTLTKTSQHLIIAAKIYDNNLNKKKIDVLFPFTLSQDGELYHLSGCILHYGQSPKAGHYIAIIEKNNQWYLCNDEVITLLSNQEISAIAEHGSIRLEKDSNMTCTPYIWFYSKNNNEQNN